DLPPRTTNPSPPRSLFDTIERLANQPPPLPAMEPPLPPFPPQLLPLGPNNPFPMLTREIFCDNCQRTQVIVNNLRDELRYSHSKGELTSISWWFRTFSDKYVGTFLFSSFIVKRIRGMPRRQELEVPASLVISRKQVRHYDILKELVYLDFFAMVFGTRIPVTIRGDGSPATK
ncbi:hypothetical protein Tco_1012217, partial [Tanacetum coccineum]